MKRTPQFTRNTREAQIERWASEAERVIGKFWSTTSKPGVSLVSALVGARARLYTADTVGRALNRIAAALEAIARSQQKP